MDVSKRLGALARTVVVLVALVLGAGTVAVGAPATPAQAGGGYLTLCFPVFDQGGTKIVDWVCHDIRLPIEMDPCPPCPDWGIGFDHLVNPADPWYVEDLMAGLGLLEQAAADPRDAERLRVAAQEAFLASAERLGDGRVRPGEVGIADRERNVIRPDAQPWLVAAGTDVGNGLTLMQQALANPDPQPWLAAAMAEFEEAYQEIVQQRPIGR